RGRAAEDVGAEVERLHAPALEAQVREALEHGDVLLVGRRVAVQEECGVPEHGADATHRHLRMAPPLMTVRDRALRDPAGASAMFRRMPEGERLRGKVAFVTGGNTGIGAAISRRLAREGAAVAVGYREDAGGAERLAGELGARCAALPCDVA